MFGLFTVTLFFCGLAAASRNDFPDFLLSKGKSLNGMETPFERFLEPSLGDMSCKMDVKIIERVVGKCETRGGSQACIAGSYVIPNHHDCIMYEALNQH